MKIAILGATGWIGSSAMAEARDRGHEVIAISRDVDGLKQQGLEAYAFDLLSEQALPQAMKDADLVIAAVGGRAKGNHEMVAKSAQRLLAELPAGKRLIWVGGAGSLEVAPGVQLATVPEFPAEYKDEAIAQAEALEAFCQSSSQVNWLFVSPAAELFPGERSGQYRVGGDQLLTNEEGKSQISSQDYAVALIDQAEKQEYQLQRISVAY